jgi:hypothetical protein
MSMSKSKIVIELTDALNPPRVFVDGEEVNTKLIDYHYETKTHDHLGTHNFNLIMPDVSNDRYQTKGIAFGK